jgi:hypothetical protein
MNCQEFWNTMPELAGNGNHDHLDDCAACAARLRREREVEAGLRAVAAGLRKLEAPPRVEARLMEVFRSQSGIEPVRSRRRWVPWLTWAAAFAAMLALGSSGPRAPAGSGAYAGGARSRTGHAGNAAGV